MLTRLLFAAALAAVFAMPAVAGTPMAARGSSERRGSATSRWACQPKRMCVHSRGLRTSLSITILDTWVRRLGYNCRGRDNCRTDYQINRDDDTLFGFATESKRFRTGRGTRVGDTRTRAERNERRKADHKLCGEGVRAILREHDNHVRYILFNRRRVFEIVVDSTFVDC